MIKFIVVSDSMHPIIRVGDQLSIEGSPENFNMFDIVLFKRHNKLVVHYVWRDQKDFNNTVATRSIKNIFLDEEPVKYSDIVGKVSNYKLSLGKKIKILLFCFVRGRL